MRSRMMKLAATSGVGAMMRHTVLCHLASAGGQGESHRNFTHCMVYGVSK